MSFYLSGSKWTLLTERVVILQFGQLDERVQGIFEELIQLIIIIYDT